MSPRPFYENPLRFPLTSHAIRRACSVASRRAGRLLLRLAAYSVASPRAGHLLPLASPLLFVRTRRSRGKISPFLQSPLLAGSGGGANVLELLVLELLLQTPSSSSSICCGSQRLLLACSSSRFSSSSPSSLHRRRRRRFCFCCPLAHGSAAIGGGLGAEEWMLLPLIKEFCV